MEFKANPKLDAALEALHPDMIETLQRWIRVPSVRAERSADNAPFGADVRRARQERFFHGNRIKNARRRQRGRFCIGR